MRTGSHVVRRMKADRRTPAIASPLPQIVPALLRIFRRAMRPKSNPGIAEISTVKGPMIPQIRLQSAMRVL